MKKYLFILCTFTWFSCSNDKSKDMYVTIDLTKQAVQAIPYSLFADTLSYLTLKMDDNSFISYVEKLYLDDNFIFLKDDRKGGIFVFDRKDGSLIANLNYFGQGPGEFGSIRAFSIDPVKRQIHVFNYPFLHKYTYNGDFLETINTDINLVDFCSLNTGDFICIAPEDTGVGEPNGVWQVNSSFKFVKTLKEIPLDQHLYVRSTFYNRVGNGIYYYDRVVDDFSYITKDSVKQIFKFDFKQRVPDDLRTKEIGSHLNPYSFISEFAHSNQYLLLNYFNFNGNPSYWVLINKVSRQAIVSNELFNDLNNIQIQSTNLFYVNDQTWCRVLDPLENNSSITIEFIHLKKQ